MLEIVAEERAALGVRAADPVRRPGRLHRRSDRRARARGAARGPLERGPPCTRDRGRHPPRRRRARDHAPGRRQRHRRSRASREPGTGSATPSTVRLRWEGPASSNLPRPGGPTSSGASCRPADATPVRDLGTLCPAPFRTTALNERMSAEQLRDLSEEECRTLLATSEIGRVGVSVRALPAIFPVRLHDVGRSRACSGPPATPSWPRSSRTRSSRSKPTPSTDDDGHGWSVLVVGRAELIDAAGARAGRADSVAAMDHVDGRLLRPHRHRHHLRARVHVAVTDDAREHAAVARSIARVLAPSSIAVVGVSRREGSIGRGHPRQSPCRPASPAPCTR